MNRIHRALALALWLGVVLASSLYAVGEGRIIGTVVDETGAPAKGVKVIFSRPGTNYKQEKLTDDKGKFTLLVIDATQEYLLRIESEGYAAYEEKVKPRVQETLRLTFNLQTTGGPTPEEEAAAAAASKELQGKNQAILTFNEGVLASRGGDKATAAVKFAQAAEMDPKLVQAYGALADMNFQLGKHKEAIVAAEKYLELQPGKVEGLRIRYDSLKALNDPKAPEALEALVAVDRTRETAVRLFNLGADASKAGKKDEAIAHLKRAIEIDPTLNPAYSAMANLYLSKKNFQEAKALAETLLQRQPGNLEGLTVRYEALKGLGDQAGAKAALAAMTDARKNASSSATDLYNQGVTLFNSNNIVDAADAFLRVLQADPKFAKAHYMLGLSYANSGDSAKAKEHLEKFLALAPNDGDAAAAKEMLTYLK